MLVGVQDVHVNVADMPRALAFYRDVLGMRVLDTSPWWTSLDFFGARIGLHGTGGASVPAIQHGDHGPLAGAVLTLRSTDLDADVAYLKANGVPVLGRSDHAWGRIALIRDPDGNVLKLMQPVSPS
jgi:catechol 2,3-dioxygenase-like lactoylglutathione lyase family enzyme